MSLSEQQQREDIVRIGRMMYERGWVAGTDGNISIRLNAERILATPTGMCKGRMSPDDLIVCDNDGNKISGQRERSSEMAMLSATQAATP